MVEGFFAPTQLASQAYASHLFILRYKRKYLLSAVATLILGHLIVNQTLNAMTIYIQQAHCALAPVVSRPQPT